MLLSLILSGVTFVIRATKQVRNANVVLVSVWSVLPFLSSVHSWSCVNLLWQCRYSILHTQVTCQFPLGCVLNAVLDVWLFVRDLIHYLKFTDGLTKCTDTVVHEYNSIVNGKKTLLHLTMLRASTSIYFLQRTL